MSMGLTDKHCSTIYIKWINDKDLLYSTGNGIQYLIITYNGKQSKENNIYIYISKSLCYTHETDIML